MPESFIAPAGKVEIPDHRGWCRLLPRSSAYAVAEGLQARTMDPLWFLSRQWQLGEFAADNGGRPVRVEVEAKSSNVDQIVTPKGTAIDLTRQAAEPWESIVEDEGKATDPRTPECWDPTRLEYRFAVKAGSTVLDVPEYTGGRLDWHDFRIRDAALVDGQTELTVRFPQTVSYPGMPVARWWQFEDGKVNFGSVTRPNLDFLTMLLIEYSITCSQDWHIIPFEQRVGSLRLIENLRVADTFGVVESIKPIVDTTDQQTRCSIFAISNAASRAPYGGQLFFLPNTVIEDLRGDPIEEVTFGRDELANVVWAIEHLCWNEAEDELVNRDDEATRKSATDPKRGELPVYRLAHMPPLNWIPYIPIQKSPDGSIILRRARTIENAEEKQFRGRILGESVFVNEEEIPATPVSVIRRCKLAIHGSEQWELVRIADNPEAWTLKKLPSRSQTIWLGRQKKWTARQAPCNLRFDYLVE